MTTPTDVRIAREIEEMKNEVINDYEKVIDGVLNTRPSPNHHWRPCTAEELTKKIISARINARLHAECSANLRNIIKSQ